MRRVKRVAAMLRSGSVASANNASPGLCNTSTMTTATIVSTLAIVNGISNTTCWICWMSVFALRHQLAGLRVVVEREVQLLQVRDESHAQIRLDAVREAERGVPPQAGADCLDHPNCEDDSRPFEGDIEVSRNNSFVDRLTRQPRDRDAGRGPPESGENPQPDPHAQRSHGFAHEAPTRPSRCPFLVQNAPGSPADEATSAKMTPVSGFSVRVAPGTFAAMRSADLSSPAPVRAAGLVLTLFATAAGAAGAATLSTAPAAPQSHRDASVS